MYISHLRVCPQNPQKEEIPPRVFQLVQGHAVILIPAQRSGRVPDRDSSSSAFTVKCHADRFIVRTSVAS